MLGPEVQISNSGARCSLFHVHPVLDPAGYIRAVTGHSEQEWEANVWVDPVSVRSPSRSLTGQGGLFRRRKGHRRRGIVRNPPCLRGFVQPEIRLRVTIARLIEWRGSTRAQLQSKVRVDELSIQEVASVTPSPPNSSDQQYVQLSRSLRSQREQISWPVIYGRIVPQAPQLPQSLSLNDLLRRHCRDRLYVPPLPWTTQHVQLLKCRFVPRPPTPQPASSTQARLTPPSESEQAGEDSKHPLKQKDIGLRRALYRLTRGNNPLFKR